MMRVSVLVLLALICSAANGQPVIPDTPAGRAFSPMAHRSETGVGTAER